MDKFARFKLPLTLLAVLLVTLLAWSLRLNAVNLLPVDFDEDDYLRAAQEYAAVIQAGDWSKFSDFNYRPEHPPLAKIMFGLAIAGDPQVELVPDASTNAMPNPNLPRPHLIHARTIGAVFGTLTVLLLALVNPLAGAYLAFHTTTVKYVAQVMLEALPALTSLVMVLTYLQSKKGKATLGWLLLSSVFLGLTAASKYLYCVIGLAILVDWFLDAREKGTLGLFFRNALIWGLLAVAVFFAADPYLWPEPVGRLRESVFYHAGYSTSSAEVQQANFPVWQPFVTLMSSPAFLKPEAFSPAIDPFIAFLAVFGLSRMWKKERLYVLWLGITMLFLLVWPTKWQQYVLTLTVPLALAAVEGTFVLIIDPLRNWYRERAQPKIATRSQLREALPWLIPGLIAFTVLTIFPLIFQFIISLTDFSATSIRDGFQGGIWREFWGGITGQIPARALDLEARSQNVHFTGLGSYPTVFDFLAGIGILFFNIIWTVLSVALQTALGLGVALLLRQRGVQLGKFWQAVFILPWAIPEMIGALMWLNIFLPDTGWIALAVQTYGPNIPFGFFAGWERSSELWLLVFLIPAIWYGFPFMMLAASAGLKLVPEEVFDAAQIDGANAWQTFRQVTLPLLMPLLLPAIIIRSIFAFNQFYLFQAFYFPDSTLATLSYNIFNPSGFISTSGQFAVSAVINIITVFILVGFVVLFNRWSKAGEGVAYA